MHRRTRNLQADGLDIYDDYDKSEHIIHLNCMAHARRYFVEAQETDRLQAEYALKEIQKLYAIERKCKDSGQSDQRAAAS